jgi:hypothetical protein
MQVIRQAFLIQLKATLRRAILSSKHIGVEVRQEDAHTTAFGMKQRKEKYGLLFSSNWGRKGRK